MCSITSEVRRGERRGSPPARSRQLIIKPLQTRSPVPPAPTLPGSCRQEGGAHRARRLPGHTCLRLRLSSLSAVPATAAPHKRPAPPRVRPVSSRSAVHGSGGEARQVPLSSMAKGPEQEDAFLHLPATQAMSAAAAAAPEECYAELLAGGLLPYAEEGLGTGRGLPELPVAIKSGEDRGESRGGGPGPLGSAGLTGGSGGRCATDLTPSPGCFSLRSLSRRSAF